MKKGSWMRARRLFVGRDLSFAEFAEEEKKRKSMDRSRLEVASFV